jgi:hypothetical protein
LVPAFFQIRLRHHPDIGQLGELFGQQDAQPIADGFLVSGVLQVPSMFFEGPHQINGLLSPEPFLMAASLPFREILFGDVPAIKILLEDRLDVWLFIEPSDGFLTGPAVLDLSAKLVTDGFGEAGDFAIALRAHKFFTFYNLTVRGKRSFPGNEKFGL